MACGVLADWKGLTGIFSSQLSVLSCPLSVRKAWKQRLLGRKAGPSSNPSRWGCEGSAHDGGFSRVGDGTPEGVPFRFALAGVWVGWNVRGPGDFTFLGVVQYASWQRCLSLPSNPRVPACGSCCWRCRTWGFASLPCMRGRRLCCGGFLSSTGTSSRG
jgi:hypothetical protein